jgi:hypothetical protein
MTHCCGPAAAGGFDSLPTAEGEDEEYGLEQEEWD